MPKYREGGRGSAVKRETESQTTLYKHSSIWKNIIKTNLKLIKFQAMA
jgi:hypothetical protein